MIVKKILHKNQQIIYILTHMSNNGAVHQEVTTIPDLDGTGPRWLGERKFSRRGRWNFQDNIINLPGSYESVSPEGDKSGDQRPKYGLGQSGLPFGNRRRMGRRGN